MEENSQPRQDYQAGNPSILSHHPTAKVKKNTKEKRQQIAVACLPCQKRKCRCDGGSRPICNTCVRRGKTCEYNIEEGLSRVAHFKEKSRELEEDSKDLKAVVELLRHGSDSDAAAILARLRVGHSISSIIQSSPNQPNPSSSNPYPANHPADSEYDLASGVPSQLQSAHIIDRGEWGRLTYQKGVPSNLQRHEAHGLRDQLRSPSLSSAIQPRTLVENTQAVPINVQWNTDILITRHEVDSRESCRLRNFGNMDFSSGILTNGYPWKVQQQQVSNLFTPQWAKMTTPIMVPEDHAFRAMSDSMIETLTTCRKMLADGQSLLDVAGSHPRLAAIMDDEAFERAPPLSQWACRMVYSIKETNRLFVCYASLYLFWWIMRWMIHPSPETYYAIPEFLRPSSTQLFMPHLLPLEFLVWPGLRDHLVQNPHRAGHAAWIYDMSLNIGCACPLEQNEVMDTSSLDGELELSPAALAYASDVDNWSVTPSFRQYFLDADRWMNIRWSQTD